MVIDGMMMVKPTLQRVGFCVVILRSQEGNRTASALLYYFNLAPPNQNKLVCLPLFGINKV